MKMGTKYAEMSTNGNFAIGLVVTFPVSPGRKNAWSRVTIEDRL
jgi:hypothetical protein